MGLPDLYYSFSGKPNKRPAITPETHSHFDADLEALIDKAGRDKVFAVAKVEGWEGMNPPKWVWAKIAADLLSGRISVKTA